MQNRGNSFHRGAQARPSKPHYFTPGIAPLYWKSVCGGFALPARRALCFIPPVSIDGELVADILDSEIWANEER